MTDLSGGWKAERNGRLQELQLPYSQEGGEEISCTRKFNVQVQAGKRYFLHLEGEGGEITVGLNGKREENVTARKCLEVTRDLQEGENIMVLKMTPGKGENILRSVSLREKGPVCLLPGTGILVSQERVSHSDAMAGVESTLLSLNGGEKVTVVVEIKDPRGFLAADGRRDVVLRQGEQKIKFSLTLIHPLLWQGRDNPYLHTVLVRLEREGKVLDQAEVSLGFREVTVEPSGEVQINGSRIGSKWEEPSGEVRSEEEYLRLLQEGKVDALRIKGRIFSDHFYHVCDQKGILLYYESLSDEGKKRLMNHPSVVLAP